jgi:hypothetical protein
MDQDTSDALPVACTLTAAEAAAMRDDLLPALLTRATARERIEGGFRWRFAPEADLLTKVAAVIETERRCCRFLRFALVVEPGDGPVWLALTGPEGTEEFLSGFTGATATASRQG